MSNIYKEEIDKKELYLPLSIDEYISENNQVRAVEDFVEMLDMVELGFANSLANFGRLFVARSSSLQLNPNKSHIIILYIHRI